MCPEETVTVETKDGSKRTCKVVSTKQVSPQQWEVTVECPDGKTKKTARAANMNEAKQLACLKCEDSA